MLGISCVMCGQYIAYRYNMRVVLLEKSLIMLSIIENDIIFLGLPVGKIISELSKKDELKKLYFLSVCSDILESGTDFQTAWTKALKKKTCFQPFSKSDIEILQSFALNFGKTDKNGQISNCKIHSSMLKENLNEAKNDQRRYASMSTVFGIMSGLCIFIIFM